MTKILVTGGAGFIGSTITDILVDRGDEVVIIDNFKTGKREYVNPKATLYEADITKEIDYIFEKEKPEKVIHAAANVLLRESLKDPMMDANINILGTINVLQSCVKHKVKKIIYCSTSARVGDPEYTPIDEKHPLRPCSPYGISKHSAEHYLETYNLNHGLDYLIFCFGNVYGPRDDPSTGRLTGLFIEKMIQGEAPKIYGDGNQTRDFIYVKDLANFLVSSLDKTPEHKLFHLANGKEVSVNEATEVMKKATGFTGDIPHIEAIQGEIRKSVFDITLVQKELGWDPKHTYEDGVKETAEWFKEKLSHKS